MRLLICFPRADIQPGQGLSAQAAQNCNSNNYGVANKTYGIALNPCR